MARPAAGRKSRAESLESTARPSASPSTRLRPRVGCSSQRIRQSAARAIVAVTAMSVVAIPAWASTGGRVVNSSTARDGGGRAAEAPGPGAHDQRSEQEEREHAQPREREVAVVAAARVQDGVSLEPDVRLPGRADAGEPGAERLHDPGQRRMQRLVGVAAAVQPLHAGRDVGRLVPGLIEHVVGRDDPRDAEGQAGRHQYAGGEPLSHRGVVSERVGFAVCLIAIVALGAGAEFATFARSDTAFLLYAAERVLDGARLYQDVVEINPPLIVALNLPAVLLARATGVSDIAIYRALVTLALLGALAFADWSLRRALEPGSDRLRRRLVLVLAFALFLAPGNDFGQREHLLVGLALPWVLLVVARVSGRPAAAGPALAAGVLAGLGLAIKPHFLLVWAAVEGYAAWRLRARRPSYEALGTLGFLALYAAGCRHPHAAVFRSRPAARPGVRRLRTRPVPARAGHGARHHGVLPGGARRRGPAARARSTGRCGSSSWWRWWRASSRARRS